jgi:hypothetical protein
MNINADVLALVLVGVHVNCSAFSIQPIATNNTPLVGNEVVNERLHDDQQFAQSLSREQSRDIMQVLNSMSISDEAVSTIGVSSSVQRQEDMSPASKTAGEGFILVYVVFSLLAGVKEFALRFKKWNENRKN